MPAPSLPPMLRKMRGPSTKGDPAAPKKPFLTPNSLLASRLQILPPRGELQAVQHAFRAEGVDLPSGDDRGSARAFVKAEIVAVSSRVFEFPDRLARCGVERFDHFFSAEAMEENQAAVGDDGAAEPLADVFFPNDRRAAGGERIRNVVAGIDAVAVGPEELRPVGAEGCRR